MSIKSYSTEEVSKLANVSLRQLQWWDEKNLISPKTHKHKRHYSQGETALVLLIAELRDRGVSLQNLKRNLTPLRQYLKKNLNSILLIHETHFLLVDPKATEVRFETCSIRVVNLLHASRKPFHVINITQVLWTILDNF